MAWSDKDFQEVLAALTPPPEKHGSFMGGMGAATASAGAGLASALAAFGVDSAQPYADRWRALSEEIARNTEGPQSWEDVNDLSSFRPYLAHLAGNLVPTAAEIVLPTVAGALMGGGLPGAIAGGAAGVERALASAAARAALGRSAVLRQAAESLPGLTRETYAAMPAADVAAALQNASRAVSVGRGANAGAALGMGAQAAGDIASNQYEQSGKYDPAAILALAPAYAALNYVGLPGAVLRGATGKAVLPFMENVGARGGLAGAAQRAAVVGAAEMPLQGLSETGQEVVNQLGRMSVDPNATLTSGDAPARYKESFVGGALMGGMGGSLTGAFTKAMPKSVDDIGTRMGMLSQDQADMAAGRETFSQQYEDALAHNQGLEKQRTAAVAQQQKAQDAATKAFMDQASREHEVNMHFMDTMREVQTGNADTTKAQLAAAAKLRETGTIDGKPMPGVDPKNNEYLVKNLTHAALGLPIEPRPVHDVVEEMATSLWADKAKTASKEKAVDAVKKFYSPGAIQEAILVAWTAKPAEHDDEIRLLGAVNSRLTQQPAPTPVVTRDLFGMTPQVDTRFSLTPGGMSPARDYSVGITPTSEQERLDREGIGAQMRAAEAQAGQQNFLIGGTRFDADASRTGSRLIRPSVAANAAAPLGLTDATTLGFGRRAATTDQLNALKDALTNRVIQPTAVEVEASKHAAEARLAAEQARRDADFVKAEAQRAAQAPRPDFALTPSDADNAMVSTETTAYENKTDLELAQQELGALQARRNPSRSDLKRINELKNKAIPAMRATANADTRPVMGLEPLALTPSGETKTPVETPTQVTPTDTTSRVLFDKNGRLVTQPKARTTNANSTPAAPESTTQTEVPGFGAATKAPVTEPTVAPTAPVTEPKLDLHKDGIDGMEVPPSSVPNGNDAFQYAVGKIEEDGQSSVFRRKASERGTYGGWRWEADKSKTQETPNAAKENTQEVVGNTKTQKRGKVTQDENTQIEKLNADIERLHTEANDALDAGDDAAHDRKIRAIAAKETSISRLIAERDRQAGLAGSLSAAQKKIEENQVAAAADAEDTINNNPLDKAIAPQSNGEPVPKWLVDAITADNATATSVLQAIADNHEKYPGYVELAQRMIQLNPDTKFVYKNEPGFNKKGKRVAAQYDAPTQTILVYSLGENSESVLHEAVHAATAYQINRAEALDAANHRKPVDSLPAGDRALVSAWKRLTALMKQTRDNFGEIVDEFKKPLENLHEFAAYSTTNPEFRAKLSSIYVDAEGKLVDLSSIEPSMLVKVGNGIVRLLVAGKPVYYEDLLNRITNTVKQLEGVSRPDIGVYDQVTGSDTLIHNGQSGIPDPMAPIYLSHGVARMVEGVGKNKTVKKFAFFTKKKFYEAVNTFTSVRQQASKSYGYTIIYRAIQAYNRVKLALQSAFNAQLQPFNVIPATLHKMVDTSLWAASHMKGTQKDMESQIDAHPVDKLYDDDTPGHVYQPGEHVLPNQELSAKGIFTYDQFRNGEVIGPDGKAVMLPKAEAEAKRIHRAYEDAMKAMQSGAVSLARAIEAAAEQAKGWKMDKALLGTTDAANNAIRSLELAVSNLMRKPGFIDLSPDANGNMKPPLTEADDAMVKQLYKDIYGIVSGKADAAQIERVAQTLDKDVAEITKAMEDISSGVNTNKPQRFSVMRDAIMADSWERPVVESARKTAIKTIISGYVPWKREGEYIVVGNYVGVNDDGSEYSISTDDVDPEFARALGVYRGDSPMELQAKVDAFLKEMKDQTFPLKLDTGKEVTAKFGFGEIGDTQFAKRVSDRHDYFAFKRTLDLFGLHLGYEQDRDLMISMTRADAAERSHLIREYHPGVDTDFLKAIAVDLSGRSALISMKIHAPQVDEVLNDEAKYWTDGKKEIAASQANYDQLMKTGNKRQQQIARSDLAGAKLMYSGQQRENMHHTKAVAVEYANWWLDVGHNDSDADMNRVLQATRTGATIAQLGGSFAVGANNLTSLAIGSLPALATYNDKTGFGGGFGVATSSAAIIKAFKTVMPVVRQLAGNAFAKEESNPENWIAQQVEKARVAYEAAPKSTRERLETNGYTYRAWKFLLQETQSGITTPQMTNAMMGYANKRLWGPKADNLMSRYMSFFSATETANRMSTLLAAYSLYEKRAHEANMSYETGGSGELSELDEYVQHAAEHTVNMSQGNYSQSDRPKLFRNGPGALIFMYKTFAITMLELMHNLPAKGAALMLGMIFMMSGFEGLPWFEELASVADFLAQHGLGTTITKGNVEREMRYFFHALGRSFGIENLDRVMMKGLLDSMLGTTVFGRSGVTVGVPGVGLARAGSSWEKEVGKALGPAVSFVGGATRSADALLRGDTEKAGKELPVVGVKNLLEAWKYAQYDNVLNKRGQIVTSDVGPMDVLARALGYFPAEFTNTNDVTRLEEYSRAYSKQISNQFLEEYRRYKVLGDREGMRQIFNDVQEHNKLFGRDSDLYIPDFGKKAERAGKEAMKELEAREVDSLPKQQQRYRRLAMERQLF